MNEETIRNAIASSLIDLREQVGKTVLEISEDLGVAYNSWRNYEAGRSIPRFDDYIRFCAFFGYDPVKLMRRNLSPDKYNQSIGIEQKRAEIIEFLSQASDADVEAMHYIIYADTGSEFSARLQKQLIEDHLPLREKVGIAKDIVHRYRLCSMLGDLVNVGEAEPDVLAVVEAISCGMHAIENNQASYNTVAGSGEDDDLY